MASIWFVLLSVMLAVYVVLDGFDLGAGILHLFVARNDEERRTVLAAIGPVWDGNEVWLLASGGTLVYAFPRAYSAGFSGFYLPLMMALWLLILRGISIEFRNLERSHLWRSLWDGGFAVSSTLLTIVLGAALGNVVRGVPLEASGFFTGPLFTNFMPGRNPGVLDWYTVTIALFTFAAISLHAATYVAWKTEGAVHDRSWKAASAAWIGVVLLGVLATIATQVVRPQLYASIAVRPWIWPLVILMIAGLVGEWIAMSRRAAGMAFGWSACFLVSMLAATALGVYPVLLTSTLNPDYSLTAQNSTAGGIGLQVGFVWWSIALVLAICYFTYLFRSFRGKVSADSGYGHE
jgi:cytochrome d ubiquinol oxidase subunit II